MSNHLDAAKSLVAEHLAATQQVLSLLDQLASNNAQATQDAVSAATSELQAANDTLSQGINQALELLKKQAAQYVVASPDSAAPAPADSGAGSIAAAL